MNLDISIMLVGSSVFAASFMLLNWMVWLWIEILIGETLELTLSAVDIYRSFLLHMGVCGEVDLSGDFWPGVSSIENSLVVSYLLVDISSFVV